MSLWTRIAELEWFIPVCCRRKGRFDLVPLWRQEEQHQPQSNDTSGWIQQAEKMCLLVSDRADTAPFSQLMLLLPSISISAADWAEMGLNFLPSARVLSLRALCVNVLWETLALHAWLVALCWQRVLSLPLTPFISAPFSIYYTQHHQDWDSNRVLNSES